MKIHNNQLNYTLNVICRWVVGAVFLFSSFVKGVDPLGTAYKVQEYMTAWNLGRLSFEWAQPLAPVLSVALICAEFVVGVLLIANAYRRMSAWLLLLMMVFFTTTTFIDALTNKVTDCGCFGDALKLTNWQTFWKNVALDVPTVWIFLTRNLRRKRRFERDGIVLISAVTVMLVFEVYNIKHEPVIDFRPWKVGRKMIEEREAMNHMMLRNLQTGETAVVDYPNGGWDQVPEQYKNYDLWEIESSTSDAPYEVLADGFAMLDLDGEDRTLDMLLTDEGLLLATVHHIEELDEADVREIRRAQTIAEEADVRMVLLTSALPEEVQAWMYENKIEGLDYLFADATAIKTVMRGNPGFMYLQNATVVDKGRKAISLKMADEKSVNSKDGI